MIVITIFKTNSCVKHYNNYLHDKIKKHFRFSKNHTIQVGVPSSGVVSKALWKAIPMLAAELLDGDARAVLNTLLAPTPPSP